jgi:hypothetical protein
MGVLVSRLSSPRTSRAFIHSSILVVVAFPERTTTASRPRSFAILRASVSSVSIARASSRPPVERPSIHSIGAFIRALEHSRSIESN